MSKYDSHEEERHRDVAFEQMALKENDPRSYDEALCQEQRDKDELRLQVRLIVFGSIGFNVEDNFEFGYMEQAWRKINHVIIDVFNCGSHSKSINMLTDYLFSQNIRAIKP